jgi:Leucine-rich repeat (LRR) protein
MTDGALIRFSSALPVIVYSRPVGQDIDWQEADRGPGYFHIPIGHEIRVRIKGIDDADLTNLVSELQGIQEIHFLDLSENRNVTNDGLVRLKALSQLTGLNLSSCAITNTGLNPLRDLPRLAYLNLSYCSRLSDPALKTLEAMKNLTYVDLQGCLGFTNGGLARIRRRSLIIYR